MSVRTTRGSKRVSVRGAMQAPLGHLTRRQFHSGCVGLCAGLMALGCEDNENAARASDPFSNAIRDALPTLDIPHAAIAEFRSAWQRGRPSGAPFGDPAALAKHFLLSSDFFRNGEDPRRPLQFVTLYGAYTSPCYHPWQGDRAFGDA